MLYYSYGPLSKSLLQYICFSTDQNNPGAYTVMFLPRICVNTLQKGRNSLATPH